MSVRHACPLCQRGYTEASICAECALRLTEAGHQAFLPDPTVPMTPETFELLTGLLAQDGTWKWDGDCTRCNTTLSWEGAAPDRPEDAICNDCAWTELRQLRTALKKILGSSDPMAAAIAQEAITPV